MNNKPLVSLIIPVYNVAKFLHESLDSAVNQTLKNIEIICVNDGSTDNSLEILNEYAAKDSRVRVINKTVNGSAIMARKDGVMAVKGKFTMFMDADDYLQPNACETAYNLIVKNDVDILCFSFTIHEYDEDGKISNISVHNQVFNEVVYGRDQIQKYFFVDKKVYIAYWNKIYKTELLKSAYSNMEDFCCSRIDDNYDDYYISYYAKQMLGVLTEPLYIYYYGRGGCADSKISLATFEKACIITKGVSLIKKFLEREGTFKEQENILYAWEHHVIILGLCGSFYGKRVKEEDFDAATNMLCSYLNDLRDDKITSFLLTQIRNHVDWNKNLAASQIQIEEKDARIKELQDWNAEQLKAKEWFLSQIANKDARIAELQKNWSLANKIRKAMKKILSKIFKEK